MPYCECIVGFMKLIDAGKSSINASTPAIKDPSLAHMSMLPPILLTPPSSPLARLRAPSMSAATVPLTYAPTTHTTYSGFFIVLQPITAGSLSVQGLNSALNGNITITETVAEILGTNAVQIMGLSNSGGSNTVTVSYRVSVTESSQYVTYSSELSAAVVGNPSPFTLALQALAKQNLCSPLYLATSSSNSVGVYSATTSTTSSSSSSSPSFPSSILPIGAIAGIIVGGILISIAFAVGSYLMYKKVTNTECR